MGTDTAEVAHCPGRPSQIGLKPGLSGWQLRASPKRGEDIAYGWKGKGSTVHLVTEGNGLPLAFLVTAANVAEVIVGLKVMERVKVPRPQGRPRQRPASLAADKSYDSAAFRSTSGVEKPPPARPTSPGASNQPESLEGRAEPRVVRQLEEIGHQV